MNSFVKSSFAGGMSQAMDSTKLADNQYAIGRNVRVRYDIATPVSKALVVGSPLAEGNLQAGVGFADGIVLFQAGKAFFKDLSVGAPGVWIAVPNVQMQATATILYTVTLPYSSNDAARVAGTEASSPLILRSIQDGSSAGLLVQDGINQPVFIDPALLAGRTTQTWNQWSSVAREYVPVGLNMTYSTSGVLYVVSPDHKRIYRSVTGRPLDFVIAVDQTAGKLVPSSSSDAEAMAVALTFDDITAILDSPTEVETFFLGTRSSGTLASPIRDIQLAPQLYGEPLYFRKNSSITTGPLNQQSVVEVLGDTVFVDTEGLKSFNAIKTLRNEGKNSPFSQTINNLFSGVTQGQTACGKFDNYSLMAVKTIFGYGILVYDDTRGIFVSLDILTIQGTTATVGEIKQFIPVRVGRVNRLFAITNDNQFLELYSSSAETDNAGMYLGDWTSGDSKVEIIPKKLDLVFINVQGSGDVRVTSYVDQKFVKSSLHRIEADDAVSSVSMPLGDASADRSKPLTIQLYDSKVGWKAGIWLEWSFKASLTTAELQVNSNTSPNKKDSAAQTWASSKNGVPRVSSVSPQTGLIATSNVVLVGENLDKVTSVKLGGIEMAALTVTGSNLIHFIVSEGGISGELILYSSGLAIPTGYNLTVS